MQQRFKSAGFCDVTRFEEIRLVRKGQLRTNYSVPYLMEFVQCIIAQLNQCDILVAVHAVHAQLNQGPKCETCYYPVHAQYYQDPECEIHVVAQYMLS